MRRVVVALALSLAGCGGEADSRPLSKALEPEGCGMVFSPDELSRDLAQFAADEWSMATGCDITISKEGLPWRTADFVYVNGKEVKGATAIEYGVPVSVTMSRFVLAHPTGPAIALHEMGHALGGNGHFLEDGYLMSPNPSAGQGIDEHSLAFVCAALGCP